jgi:hypothetical protein
VSLSEDPRPGVAARLREQAAWCGKLGSPLYAHLLERASEDFAAGGPCRAVLAGREADPGGSMLALRFAGAVHRLALEGRAPELAGHYPSAGGDAARPGAWEAFREAVAAHAGELRDLVDPATQEGRLTLLSYVWPDQEGRLAALRGAIEIARRVPARVERADAAEWLEERLAAPAPGVATVVFHSIVMQYLPRAGRQRVRELIAAAGERAGPGAPLAWLRMESGGAEAEVHLTSWPGGEEQLLAEAGYHGCEVRWLAA